MPSDTAHLQVAVVGAGLMGSGIAQVSAVAGHQVTLRDVDEAALGRAKSGVRASLDRLVSKQKLTEEEAAAALERISTTTDLAAVAGADIVVEAIFEDVAAKQVLFAELDDRCAEGALLATNTSAIPITTIAAATSRPESVVGTHFFSPVPVMGLCELVRGLQTSDETLERARTFAEGLGKTCVVVNRDVAGFVTTRLLTALAMEAVALCESGVASAEDIDTACRLGFGHAMGPLATLDLTGTDIMYAAAQEIHRATGHGKFAPPELLARMVAAGRLGRKSGQGFYSYDR